MFWCDLVGNCTTSYTVLDRQTSLIIFFSFAPLILENIYDNRNIACDTARIWFGFFRFVHKDNESLTHIMKIDANQEYESEHPNWTRN